MSLSSLCHHRGTHGTYLAFSLSENDSRQHQTAQHACAQHNANTESHQCFEWNEFLCLANTARTILIAVRTGTRASHARIITVAIARFNDVPLESLERLVGHVIAEVAQTCVGGFRWLCDRIFIIFIIWITITIIIIDRSVWHRFETECRFHITAMLFAKYRLKCFVTRVIVGGNERTSYRSVRDEKRIRIQPMLLRRGFKLTWCHFRCNLYWTATAIGHATDHNHETVHSRTVHHPNDSMLRPIHANTRSNSCDCWPHRPAERRSHHEIVRRPISMRARPMQLPTILRHLEVLRWQLHWPFDVCRLSIQLPVAVHANKRPTFGPLQLLCRMHHNTTRAMTTIDTWIKERIR